MIYLIPKVNLGVGEMGFMSCDLYLSLRQTFAGGYKFDEFYLFDLCFARRHTQFSKF